MRRWRGCSRAGRVVDGEFRPGGRGREWCDAEVLRTVRQRSLARLRQEVEPVEAAALGRFLVGWHGLARPRHGLDGLLDVIEQLQGVPIAASVLDTEVLAARVQRLLAGDARHAARRRRSDVGRRRAARRARRPHRAVSHRSPVDAAAAGCAGRQAQRRARPAATRRSSPTSIVTARRSSVRCTMPPAAAFRRKRSMRFGIWCGRACSPTTRCMRCARIRRRPSAARRPSARRRRSDRAG